MPDYKCVRSFKSSYTNHDYYYGNKITSHEYNALPYSDRNNFTKAIEEEGYGSTGYVRFDERNIDDSKELKNGLQ